MTEQPITTVIDMREASRDELLDLSKTLLDVSKLLKQQGLRLEIRKSCTHDDQISRLSCRHCMA